MTAFATQQMARRTVGDQAADYVRGLILNGELRPGDRVPQAEVADLCGISRTPLREALVVLDREGWLTIEPHRGAFVNALDARSVADHYRLYGLMLGLAAKLAIERSGCDLVDRLEKTRRAFGATSASLERSRLAIEFNRELLDAARSLRLRQVLKLMRGLPLEHYFDLVPSAEKRQERLFRSVIAAVRQRNGDMASAAYTDLMRDSADAVIRLLEEREVITGAPTDPTASREAT